MDVGSIIAGGIGVIGAWAGKQASGKIFGLDSKITGAYKSVQPALALGFGLVLPKACQLVGLAVDRCPTGDALAGAPLGVISGIVVYEVFKRLGVRL